MVAGVLCPVGPGEHLVWRDPWSLGKQGALTAELRRYFKIASTAQPAWLGGLSAAHGREVPVRFPVKASPGCRLDVSLSLLKIT